MDSVYRLGRICFCLLWFILPVEPATAQPKDQELPPAIKEIIKDSEANQAFWSIVVRDTTGHYLINYHGSHLFTPASNMKLLTSAVALEELGPNFRYKTYMYGTGHLKDSVWVGNIVIRGSGDPSISGAFYNNYRLFVMNEFFTALNAMGITKIGRAHV